MHELRMELHSQDKAVKVDAVKKVIASMTGKSNERERVCVSDFERIALLYY